LEKIEQVLPGSENNGGREREAEGKDGPNNVCTRNKYINNKKNPHSGQAQVVHTLNPIYRRQRTGGSPIKPAWAKS
jgi:hypothetical protein